MSHLFEYFSLQTWYEAIVNRLVPSQSGWLEVGGGKSCFSYNIKLAKELSDRCKLLVGMDPSENIFKSPFVHQAFQCVIENFDSKYMFDLATMRMVVAHIENPRATVNALARLIKSGGYVVIFTPYRWSVVPILAALVPNGLHSSFTHLLWKTKETDVSPTFH